MKKPTYLHSSVLLLLAILMFAGSGCSSLSGKFSLPTWGSTSSPTQIVAVWEPVIRHENDKALRGFAAKVMFYDHSAGKKALRVKGNFDVYAFDEDNPGENRTVPTRIIRFQVDDLKKLESDSKLLGKSYTIWVPWDDATYDAQKKNISLIVRFKCDDGTMVMSHMTKVSLPGMNSRDELEDNVVVNPFADEKQQQLARLEDLAKKRRNNPNSLDTKWTGNLPEYVINRADRPEGMLVRTMNVPGVSRSGEAPNIQVVATCASPSDEQKYQAREMLAQAQSVRVDQQTVQVAQNTNSVNPAMNPAMRNPAAMNQAMANPAMNQPMNRNGNTMQYAQMTPNPGFPINQVQYQSQNEAGQPYQQPVNAQSMNAQSMNAQSMTAPSQGLVPFNEEAAYREFLLHRQQQQQQAMQQQAMLQQQPVQNPLELPFQPIGPQQPTQQQQPIQQVLLQQQSAQQQPVVQQGMTYRPIGNHSAGNYAAANTGVAMR